MTLEHAPTTRGIPLLEVDPELGAEIPDEEQALARRVTLVPRLDLPPGHWSPGQPSDYGQRVFGLLVLDGLLTRSVLLAERSATQVLGPGDVVAPWQPDDELVPAGVEWTVNSAAQLAVLDDRFLVAARRWPALTRALHQRLADQGARLAVHAAITQLPRVETRIVAILWHLAERFGRVGPQGVVVPLRLTHEALGRLIGAQRPTVSLALRTLADEGALERRSDGAWVLHEASHASLAPATGRAPDRTPSIALLPGAAGRLGDARRRAEPDRALTGSDRDRLRERLELLRIEWQERNRAVERLLDDCRATNATSASLRRRLREARRARLPSAG